jgi:hypothetical protein
MTTERGGDIPDWAREERAQDLAWIGENRTSFWPAAQARFRAQGRGVIVVDTTQQPDPNAGHPMYYLPQEAAEQVGDADVARMVAEYDPRREFVVTLLKPEERVSSYRVQTVQKVQRGKLRGGRKDTLTLDIRVLWGYNE